ncbi:hypothetical protein AGDE_14708 [Angomonas deanei]|uniref:Uncharacterized protein n=1 Tax=Angomonas deanei TaxID=59799 RepID=A0A7G2CBF0_9TRYP|nr:hypothetical protein AGDE_14708 [Angomonas deanei]CAD2215362.1 hypothetical protein, conserved [Angomonas deanei]|eukprot:EPY20382.1 hypothetical protein AGDE_14708 [Angomonas deanei]
MVKTHFSLEEVLRTDSEEGECREKSAVASFNLPDSEKSVVVVASTKGVFSFEFCLPCSDAEKVAKSSVKHIAPPPPAAGGKCKQVSVSLSPTGSALVVYGFSGNGGERSYYGLTADWDPSSSQHGPAGEWVNLGTLYRNSFSAPDMVKVDWTGTECILCLWSDGALRMVTKRFEPVAAGFLTLEQSDKVIKLSAFTCLDESDAKQHLILTAVVEFNIITAYHIEVDAKVGSFRVLPLGSFYSAEIPVRDLFYIKSAFVLVCVLLESGAILVLDTKGMSLELHRPFRRVYEPLQNIYGEDAKSAGDKPTTTLVVRAPFAMCIVERDSLVVFREG